MEFLRQNHLMITDLVAAFSVGMIFYLAFLVDKLKYLLEYSTTSLEDCAFVNMVCLTLFKQLHEKEYTSLLDELRSEGETETFEKYLGVNGGRIYDE